MLPYSSCGLKRDSHDNIRLTPKNFETMTFKEATLPVTIYLKFDNDDEVYDGQLIDITGQNKTEDSCMLHVDGIMPQTVLLQIPLSQLESDVMNFSTGVTIYLNNPERPSTHH